MDEITTWESAANVAPEAVPADAGAVTEVTEQPVETQTVEADPTLETDAPLVAEEAARGGESPETEQVAAAKDSETEDADVEEGDTPEIRALPSGSASKKWARRQFHDAAPIRKYHDLTAPISEVADDLFRRSQSRYTELVDDITANHADYISKKQHGLTVAEVAELKAKAGLSTQSETPATPIPTAQPAATAQAFTEEELNTLDWSVADRIQAMQETQAREKAEAQAKEEALQKRLDALEGKFTTSEQQKQQELLQSQQAEAHKIGQDLYDSVWTVVEQGLRDTGLEASKDDTQEIADLKEAARDLLAKARIESAFDEDPENVKLVEGVMAAANRRERDNAFREEDNLKVRARAAFEKVKATGKVQSILRQLESHATKSHRPRTVPAPPVPGSAAGMTVKPPSNWDEAVAGAAG
jgi:hypothetical protein